MENEIKKFKLQEKSVEELTKENAELTEKVAALELKLAQSQNRSIILFNFDKSRKITNAFKERTNKQ